MTRRNAPAGCGRGAGRGLSAGREQRFRDAIRSVPRLQFVDGLATIENVTRQQLTGLNHLANQADKKTGSAPVWDVVVEGTTATVTHLRYRQGYLDRQEYNRLTALVPRITFRRKMATFTPENEEQEQGLLIVAERHNWALNKQGERYHIAKAG